MAECTASDFINHRLIQCLVTKVGTLPISSQGQEVHILTRVGQSVENELVRPRSKKRRIPSTK